MTPAAVIADGLVLGFDSRVALAESSFEMPAGKATAVIGPNGSGKTTLMDAIAGLIEPLAGTIEVRARAEGGTERISYVLQTTAVNASLPITVREVVTMGRYAGRSLLSRLDAADRGAVEVAMRRAGVLDFAGKHLGELSGGERQRVFVAQGLAQEHDLLLLDEPLTGIDFPTARSIDAMIHEELDEGCTVILTTHDLSEAMVADHAVLVAGRVIAFGPPEEVLTRENLARAYGPAMLHGDGGDVFVDDPAHDPAAGREPSAPPSRTIHTEADQTDRHGDHG
jgi:iron complex transport system ATP-binding protein